MESLKDIYTDELKDLWSANDQMQKIVQLMAKKASDSKLKSSLQKSFEGIAKHSESIKKLLEQADEDAEMEHCKGMEGLVKEATKHITKEAPDAEGLLDLVIIAQYQRMSHYGLAGFGTAAAYANALGLPKHADKLHKIVGEIYKSDKYASSLATQAEKAFASESEAEEGEEDDQ